MHKSLIPKVALSSSLSPAAEPQVPEGASVATHRQEVVAGQGAVVELEQHHQCELSWLVAMHQGVA